MIDYLALQIRKGNLTYTQVLTNANLLAKYSNLKEGIDANLIENGREDLIVEV